MPLKRPSVATWPSIRYPYGCRLACQVLRESACLTQRVLAGRRIDGARRLAVLHGGAVAERPDVLRALDAEVLVDDDATALVEREVELGRGAGSRGRRSSTRACVPERARRSQGPPRSPSYDVECRSDVDLDPASVEPARRVLAEAARDLREDLRRRVDEHPALRHVTQAGIRPQRRLRHVVELGERLDSRRTRRRRRRSRARPGRPGGSRRARAAGGRCCGARSHPRDP